MLNIYIPIGYWQKVKWCQTITLENQTLKNNPIYFIGDGIITKDDKTRLKHICNNRNKIIETILEEEQNEYLVLMDSDVVLLEENVLELCRDFLNTDSEYSLVVAKSDNMNRQILETYHYPIYCAMFRTAFFKDNPEFRFTYKDGECECMSLFRCLYAKNGKARYLRNNRDIHHLNRLY
jgi:hypothetical protein